MRLLNLTHQTLYNRPYPSFAHHIDSSTYDFGWNGLRDVVISDVRGLPSLDHALFLIKATKFHTGQISHLFDKKTFFSSSTGFIKTPHRISISPGCGSSTILFLPRWERPSLGQRPLETFLPERTFFDALS